MRPFRLTPLFGRSYARKIQTLFGSSIVAYWPLWEATGSQAADISGNGYNGSYTGVTLAQPGIGDGKTSPFFDSLNDFANVYSAGLNTAYPKQAGTLMIWWKVYNVGVWTDATARYGVCMTTSGSQDRWWIYKQGDNAIFYQIRAAGVAKTVSKGSISPTDWIHLGMTWSFTADEFIQYYNGAAIGAPTTGIGSPSAAGLVNTGCVIGANTITPTSVMHGWLAHALLLDRPATASEFAKVAQV